MAVDFTDRLVVGVSSRALFDLEEENAVFEDKGIQGYREFQQQKEEEPLEPGTAFKLVKNLLQLNQQAEKPIVEVIVMSKNSPETGVRMLKSIKKYDLGITRIALSGGEPLAPYIEGFSVDLFLSKSDKDVQSIIDSGACAAAKIYAPPKDFEGDESRVKIAFDADAVLFSDDSEYRNKTEGLEAFHKYESQNADTPLEQGPFANLLIKLSKIQSHLPSRIELTPLRLAIVTARNAPSHMRVINTLRKWGVYVDEAYFLGGLSKDKILKAFGAHIFFDDQQTHIEKAGPLVPSAQVPYRSDSKMQKLTEQPVQIQKPKT